MTELNQRGKLTADVRYVRPEKAEKLLKRARTTKQTVYISGAAGYGKTELIADYFARKHYEYVSAKDGKQLLQFCEQMQHWIEENPEKEAIFIIDDLQYVDEEQQREQIYPFLECFVETKNVWLIMASRAFIPMWLKSLHIKHIFVQITEEELGLSSEEQIRYLEKWEVVPSKDMINKIQQQMEGHPLCLRIFAMQFQQMFADKNHGADRAKCEQEVVTKTIQDLYDYFEIHVYEQWNVELQEFIMDMSIVDCFDLRLAQLITKKNDVGKCIRNAMEMGTFLEEQTEQENYQYHMRLHLRRSMLRRLKRKRTTQYIEDLYYSAGMYYELAGNVKKALEMYSAGNSEEGISRLLVENTRTYAGAGYYFELRRYYLNLSEDIILHNPELMAGMSLLQSILLNDEESEKWYQRLQEYTKSQRGSMKKMAQEKLMYLDIALPHRGTVHMVDILKNAGALFLEKKYILPEFSLTNNQPSIMDGGKDFCEWSKHDKELAKSIGFLTERLLGHFGKGLVHLAMAESYFEKGMDNYEVASYANQGRMQAEGGGKKELVFVAIGLLAQLSLLNHHADEGIAMLDSFKENAQTDAPQLLQGVEALKTRLYLYMGRSAKVAEWMETAPDENKEFCTLERYRYLTKARVCLSMGKKGMAAGILQQMYIYAEQRQRTHIQIETLTLLAITKFRMQQEGWQETLQKAITRAEEYHFVRVLSREGAALYPLFRQADFVWKSSDFQKQVLTECEKMASFYPMYLSEKSGGIVLSDMAVRILQMQSEGLSNSKIADRLGLSAEGVKYYNKDTYKKLGVNSKAAAVTEARNRRLI